MGVSSIQSQTPLLCRVHKGGVQFFSFAALSAHQCSHSQCRSICPCRGMSLPIVCRNERREGKIAFCWMLKVLNTLRFRRDHVSKHPPRVPSVRKLWEWWSKEGGLLFKWASAQFFCSVSESSLPTPPIFSHAAQRLCKLPTSC